MDQIPAPLVTSEPALAVNVKHIVDTATTGIHLLEFWCMIDSYYVYLFSFC